MKQEVALGILQAGRNVFLTGSAGTGKTFLINQYITYLKERGIKPAIVAPTGIAASHIGGTTIHSFFGVGIQEDVSEDYINNLLYRKYLHSRFKNLKVLIVDEISMVSPALFNSMDRILKAFKHSEEPFGGVQLILSGDFFQLPPVSTSGQEFRFVWQAELWQQSNLRVCYLEEKFRQDETDELVNILDEIRAGDVSEGSFEIFQGCYRKKLNSKFRVTKLYTHNVDVDRINQGELDKIEEKEEIFIAQTKGPKKQLEKIFNSSLVSEELTLKKGATVIFIKNNFEKGYINGTLGKITRFTDDNYYKGVGLPVVELFSGREIVVEFENWIIENDKGEVKASVKQMPLRLAWALTVHKSQGMTLDAAEIDLSQTFEVGQGYVALSRVRSIKGLRLMGMNNVALQVDPAVLKIDKRMRQLSSMNVRKWQSFSKNEREEMFRDFIIQAGGTVDEEEILRNKKNLEIEEKDKREFFAKQNKRNNSERSSERGVGEVCVAKSFGKKRSGETLQITKKFIEQRKSLGEIAEKRGISERTIQDHLNQIMEKWPEIDIEYLKPSAKIIKVVKRTVESIKKRNDEDDFLENGNMRLRVIYEKLNKEISYEDIKLALLFI